MSEHAIIIEGLSKSYGSKKALNNLSFCVRKVVFFGLLGPNGAGKSTTLNILSQLVQPDLGSVSVQGFDYYTQPFESKQSLGIVPQEFNFNIFESPFEIILNQGGYYGFSRNSLIPRCNELLKKLDLSAYAHHPSRVLSGGMKRRLMIARALIHSPQVLILDEPTVGVDPQLRSEIWDFLKELNSQGVTILLTSHYFEEVEELCDEVAMIQSGKLLLQLPKKEFLKKLPLQNMQIEVQTDPDQSILDELKNLCPRLQKTALHTFEYQQYPDEPLGDLINLLDRYQIKVLSIGYKKARLEQIFLSMLQQERMGI